jgi:hypothetical protein
MTQKKFGDLPLEIRILIIKRIFKHKDVVYLKIDHQNLPKFSTEAGAQLPGVSHLFNCIGRILLAETTTLGICDLDITASRFTFLVLGAISTHQGP